MNDAQGYLIVKKLLEHHLLQDYAIDDWRHDVSNFLTEYGRYVYQEAINLEIPVKDNEFLWSSSRMRYMFDNVGDELEDSFQEISVVMYALIRDIILPFLGGEQKEITVECTKSTRKIITRYVTCSCGNRMQIHNNKPNCGRCGTTINVPNYDEDKENK